MILKFSFAQLYNNGVLENILHKIIHKIYPNAVIEAKSKEVFLYARGEEDELSKFADDFSALLPISLFYTFVKSEIVDFMPKQKELTKPIVSNLPFSHIELKEFLENPSFDNIDKSEIDDKIALLKDGKSINLDTRQGQKKISVLKKGLQPSFIMPTDISILSKLAVVSNEELRALVSFEKPTIELKVNLIYKNKNILKDDFVKVKICDTLALFYICKKLFESGVEFLSFSGVDGEENSSSLDVNILENGAVVLLGEHEYMQNRPLAKFDKKADERFASIIGEYSLSNDQSLNFFLSKKHDDMVMVYSPKLDLMRLAYIKLPNSFEELLSDIEQNQGGKTLLQNYKKEYGEFVQNALKLELSEELPKNFYTLLGMAGVLLGYGQNLTQAADEMLKHAKRFSGTKGVRIDVKPQKENLPSHINVSRFIQSALSFRLAGVDEQTISYGYLESIAYFVSDMSDRIVKEIGAKSVSLSGELFSFKRLLEVATKNIQPNHKLYINKAYAIE